MEPLTYITFFGALFVGLFVGWLLGSEKYKLKMRLRDLERKPQIKHYRTIDRAVHSLDYKKILKAMEAVGWKYADKDFDKDGNIPMHTPTIPELRECATMVCTDAVAYLEGHPGNPGFASCGGFDAEADYDEDGELWLSLKFVLNGNCP